MELGNSWLPDLSRPGMRDEDKMRAINEYLIDFEKKVRHALSNIDEDNLSEAMMNTLNGAQTKIRELEESRPAGPKDDAGNDVTWLDVVLTSAGWTELAQTVNATGVTADDDGCVVIVSPDPASYDDYTESGIRCTAQGAGTLTFTAQSAPTSNVTVNVVIVK